MGKLTDRTIKAIRTDGRTADGGGLYFVRRGSSTSWSLRWMKDGKSHEMSLGPYPVVSLAEAREKALKAKREIVAGKDPLAERDAQKAAQTRTFASVVDLYVAAHSPAWKHPRHAMIWRSSIDRYALPVLGEKPIATIDTDDVLSVLEPIWPSKNPTATRLRGRIEAVLAYATARRWRSGPNPAQWRNHIDKLLPPPKKLANVVNRPAVPYAELPVVMRRLEEAPGMGALCLRFAILTAARSNEARGATWREIDFEKRLWILPASRMKGNREHRVALSESALAILRELEPLKRRDDDLVFPGARAPGARLNDVTLQKALRRAGGGEATPHGTARASFRTWSEEQTAFPRAVTEAALAHRLGDATERSYQRGDLLEKRRLLMEAWANHLARRDQGGEVVSLQRIAS